MKQFLIFSFILVIYVNSSFAQEIKDSLKTDSIGSVILNKPIRNVLAGYASKIDYDDFNKGAIFSPMQLIQGKVPGFVVNCLNTNDPNPNLQIQSRGISTLILSTEPLYIIDGIPLESPDIISTENIESIEVLKGLYETAVYGIRGANGVVIIKTKSSYSKPLTISYNTYMYGEAFTRKSSYMSANEWRTLKQNWASSAYATLNYGSSMMTDYNANTDWRKEISQNKLSQAHNLGFFGGFNKTSYTAMINYNNYNGIIQKTDNTTYSGQFSVTQLALKDKLQVDVSLISSYRKYSEINDNPYLGSKDATSGLENSNILSFANLYNPTIPVYKPDGTYGMDGTNEYTSITNPIYKLNNTIDNRELKNTLVHVQASYEIIKGLKFSGSWSKYNITAKNILSNYDSPLIGNQILSMTKQTNDQKEQLYSLKLNYTKSSASHNLDISLNYSRQKNTNNYNYRDSIITNNSPYRWSSRTGDGNYEIENLSGSVKYNYKFKYYLSLSMLKETSPFYNSNKSAQYLPSLSGAWSLRNEDFLNSIAWLNELKIRAGYGVSQRMIKYDNTSGFESNTLPNPKLHGENMQESNFGLDISLLSNRVCFTADFYNRKTKDGVVYITSAYTYLMNETEIQNKGWEFYIKGQPLINRLKWTLDFNISFNKNSAISQGISNYGINLKDQSLGNLYGYQFAGFSSTNRMLVYDKNGNISTTFSNNGKILGNGVPRSFFGFTNTFEYKNFDLSIFIRGALGFDIANFVKADSYGYINHKKVTLTTDQRNIINVVSLQETDYIIEKGDYVKISNISLGYTIPIEKKLIKSAKLYIACNNVALFTKATDIDPEMAGVTGLNPGNYYYERYPETRMFILGLKVLL